jgi:hypothetical protein
MQKMEGGKSVNSDNKNESRKRKLAEKKNSMYSIN